MNAAVEQSCVRSKLYMVFATAWLRCAGGLGKDAARVIFGKCPLRIFMRSHDIDDN